MPENTKRNGFTLNGSLKTISIVTGICVGFLAVFGFVAAIGADRQQIRELQRYRQEDREWVERHKEVLHTTPDMSTRIEDKLDNQSGQIAVNTQRIEDLIQEVARLRVELTQHRMEAE